MRVRPVSGVSVQVGGDGCLDLTAHFAGHPARQMKCSPLGTLMWIILRQHEGDMAQAAVALAVLWQTTPDNARADLDLWMGELQDAGVLRAEP